MPDDLFVAGVASCEDHIKQGPTAIIYCNDENPSFIANPYNSSDCEFCKVDKNKDYRLRLSTLPDNLSVGGSLYLSDTQIKALPDNLSVGGSLDLRGTQIKALPDNLSVGGSLYLRDTQIKALPDNLSVGGSLDLSDTQIKALPDNLSVGGYLDLSDTQITKKNIPKHLRENVIQHGGFERWKVMKRV